MSDLAKLSAKKLHAVIAQREKHWSATLDATIRAGLGEVRYSEMVELAKGSSLLARTAVALAYLNARHDVKAAWDELDARKAYHGSDKPIKRA